jgi:opacity protein-like surface antigen
MKKFTLLLPALLLLGLSSASAQWSLQYLSASRTNSSTEASLSGTAFALERNVSFIPFLRLSARVTYGTYEGSEEVFSPVNPSIALGTLGTDVTELTGTALLGIPLGSWLKVYGGYGWVFENTNITNVFDVSTTSTNEKNFGFATVYGARVSLGRYLSVHYEIRGVTYDRELDSDGDSRSVLGFGFHF